jgi:hypothetical protein
MESSSDTVPDNKYALEHAENITAEKHINNIDHQDGDATGKDFTVDENDLPPGYFRSKYFLGSMFAVGLSLCCGVAGFSFIAPLLSFVNDDLGPSPFLVWVALTYT